MITVYGYGFEVPKPPPPPTPWGTYLLAAAAAWWAWTKWGKGGRGRVSNPRRRARRRNPRGRSGGVEYYVTPTMRGYGTLKQAKSAARKESLSNRAGTALVKPFGETRAVAGYKHGQELTTRRRRNPASLRRGAK